VKLSRMEMRDRAQGGIKIVWVLIPKKGKYGAIVRDRELIVLRRWAE
jgi:hypothetical protein